MNLGEYEKEQIRAIDEWRLEKPSGISVVLGFVMFLISFLIRAFVPKSVIQGAIEGSSAATEW